MNRNSPWEAHERTRMRLRLGPHAYGRRWESRVWHIAILIGMGWVIGCSGSKSGDRPTRWSTADQKSSRQKDK